MNALTIGTIATNVAAWITLVVLFFWTAKSSVFAIEAKHDKDDQWWDLDLKEEERILLKTVFNLFVLVVSCGTLFVPMKRLWSPSVGRYNRFNMGALASAMFLFGSMLFISFWYSVNFSQEEMEEQEEREWDDDKYDYWYEEIEAEYLLVHHRKVIAYVSFVLALAYSILSILLYDAGRKLPEARRSTSARVQGETREAYVAGHMEILSELWSKLSKMTMAVIIVLFVLTIIASGAEKEERMFEQGGMNLITVLLWLVVVASQVSLFGLKILGDAKLDGTLGVGMLSGGSEFFALLLFMVFLLYLNTTFGEDKKEEGDGTASATSFACLFLSLLYFTFSRMTYKYQRSIICSLPDYDDEDEAVDVREENNGSAAGDFERMEDDAPAEVEMKSGTGDFKKMEDGDSEVL